MTLMTLSYLEVSRNDDSEWKDDREGSPHTSGMGLGSSLGQTSCCRRGGGCISCIGCAEVHSEGLPIGVVI